MATITLKNIPSNLHEQLKKRAFLHHRSLNSEIIYYLERAIFNRKVDVDSFLNNLRRLRRKVCGTLDDKTLNALKREGRP